MGDKESFPQRLADLRLNPDALEEVQVIHNSETRTIPNADGKRGSLQVFTYITSNDSQITPEAARKGLEIFGEELRSESKTNPGKHPNIELLEDIARGQAVPSYVVRRDLQNLLHPD